MKYFYQVFNFETKKYYFTFIYQSAHKRKISLKSKLLNFSDIFSLNIKTEKVLPKG